MSTYTGAAAFASAIKSAAEQHYRNYLVNVPDAITACERIREIVSVLNIDTHMSTTDTHMSIGAREALAVLVNLRKLCMTEDHSQGGIARAAWSAGITSYASTYYPHLQATDVRNKTCRIWLHTSADYVDVSNIDGIWRDSLGNPLPRTEGFSVAARGIIIYDNGSIYSAAEEELINLSTGCVCFPLGMLVS